MICKRCKSEIPFGYICPNCGADNIILTKAKAASLRQYNKGVAFVKEGDYSSAIEALKACILFDKRNFVARNLIGILYFKTGLVGDALKEWIISCSFKKNRNPAKRYIDSIQENARLLEKYNDAVEMYNKALEKFKNQNYDLAVIQLKKAIDINPTFIEAQNLLAAYYLSTKNRGKAKKLIYKVLKIDKRNPKALAYLSEITSVKKGETETKKEILDDETEIYGGNGKPSEVPILYKEKSSIGFDIICFASGIALTAAIFLVLVMPSLSNTEKSKITELQRQISQLEEENLNGTSVFAIKYNNLEEELKKTQQENDKYKGEYSVKQRELDMQSAETYITAQNYEEAANLLYNINLDGLSEEDILKIDNLKEQCYPQAAESIFEQGSREFRNSNFDTAKTLLTKSLDMSSKDDFSDDALYILARIAEQEEDFDTAKDYYSKIVNEFSNSDIFTLSENRLNELLSTQ